MSIIKRSQQPERTEPMKSAVRDDGGSRVLRSIRRRGILLTGLGGVITGVGVYGSEREFHPHTTLGRYNLKTHQFTQRIVQEPRLAHMMTAEAHAVAGSITGTGEIGAAIGLLTAVATSILLKANRRRTEAAANGGNLVVQ